MKPIYNEETETYTWNGHTITLNSSYTDADAINDSIYNDMQNEFNPVEFKKHAAEYMHFVGEGKDENGNRVRVEWNWVTPETWIDLLNEYASEDGSCQEADQYYEENMYEFIDYENPSLIECDQWEESYEG